MPNQKAETLKNAIDKIIDKWADDLLRVRFQGSGSEVPKPRGLWDKIKSGFYGIFKGDTKQNPYYYKNRFGDFLGSESSGLREYSRLKTLTEQAEDRVFGILNEESSLENLRLFKIVKQAAEDLKSQIRGVIDGMVKAKESATSAASSSSSPVAPSDSSVVPSDSSVAPSDSSVAPSDSSVDSSPSSANAPVSKPASTSRSSRRKGPVSMPAKMDPNNSSPKDQASSASSNEASPNASQEAKDPMTEKRIATMRLFIDFAKLSNKSVRQDKNWLLSTAKIKENMQSLFEMLENKIEDDKKKDSIFHQLHKRWKSSEELVGYLKSHFIDSFKLTDQELKEATEKVAGNAVMPELDKDSKEILLSLGSASKDDAD